MVLAPHKYAILYPIDAGFDPDATIDDRFDADTSVDTGIDADLTGDTGIDTTGGTTQLQPPPERAFPSQEELVDFLRQ